jgi:hypothetical protein
MKNRNLTMKRIEQIENSITKMKYFLNSPTTTREIFLAELESSEERLNDLKTYIEREPITPNEVIPY